MKNIANSLLFDSRVWQKVLSIKFHRMEKSLICSFHTIFLVKKIQSMKLHETIASIFFFIVQNCMISIFVNPGRIGCMRAVVTKQMIFIRRYDH